MGERQAAALRPEGGVGAGDGASGGGIPLPPETGREVPEAARMASFLDPVLAEDVREAETLGRVVDPRGTVRSGALRRRAERVAARVQGASRVVSEPRAGPAPPPPTRG
jgi:hypothetical protein